MRVVIIINENYVYENKLVVETEDMDYLKKILAEKVEDKASGIYQAMDILEAHGIKIVDKEEFDNPFGGVTVNNVYEVDE